MRAGEAVAKRDAVALIMGHGEKRGMVYEVRWGEPAEQAAPELASRAVPFALPTLTGDRYDLGAVIGQRPIVLVFWASWCAPCIKEAPHLVRLRADYAEQIELVSVSIDTTEDHAKLRQVVRDLKIDYPVALDPEGDVLAKYARGASIPLTFVVNRAGEVAYRSGNYEPGDEKALAEAVERVLKGEQTR